MVWKNLEHLTALEELDTASFTHPILILKHSTRCSISDVAKARLDREDNLNGVDFIYLDLIKHRDISNALAEKYNVHHESPQVLLIYKGECVYDESHIGISMAEIKEQVASLSQ
jgi:bacillithiol system protein YtxJ